MSSLPSNAAAYSGPPAACAFDLLPDDLISRILALAGQGCGPAVTLVCKHWRLLFFSEPSLCSSFHLRASNRTQQISNSRWEHDRLAFKHRQLQQHGHLVTALVLHGCGNRAAAAALQEDSGCSLGDFLALIPAAALEQASLHEGQGFSAEPLCALRRFSRLHRLELELGCSQLSNAALAALRQLSSLRSVRCSIPQIPLTLVSNMAALPQLTNLELRSRRSLLPAFFYGLSHLTRLRRLRCRCSWLPAELAANLLCLSSQLERLELLSVLPLPPLQQLTGLSRLTHLVLRDNCGRHEELVSHPPLPAQFASLRSYEFSQTEEGAPGQGRGYFKVAGARLHSVCCSCSAAVRGEPAERSEFDAPPDKPALTLAISGLHDVPSLQSLLLALQPAGQPIACLQLGSLEGGYGCWLKPQALGSCACLAGLQSLRLHGCTSHPAYCTLLFPEFEALLQQAPNLTELDLRGSEIRAAIGGSLSGGSFPEPLAARRGLKRLFLNGHDLRLGACLEGLEELRISGGPFVRTKLPPELTAATSLRRLVISEWEHLEMTQHDVDSVLLRLPALTWLHLGPNSTPPHVLECLQQRASYLVSPGPV